jgi:hypothetical protein
MDHISTSNKNGACKNTEAVQASGMPSSGDGCILSITEKLLTQPYLKEAFTSHNL